MITGLAAWIIFIGTLYFLIGPPLFLLWIIITRKKKEVE